MSDGVPPAASARLVAIDAAKGVAILGVLLIHSNALGQEDFVFMHFVNHAVPIFIVLFGLNAEQWWRAREPATPLPAWYARSVRRVLVPVWLMLPVWWALALYFRPLDVPLTRTLPLRHLAGYLVHVGTGWFVTLLVQLVAVFPLLHVLARRIGLGPFLAVGGAASALLLAYRFTVAGWLGCPFLWCFPYLVFAPRFVALVAFGMWLAPRVARLGVAHAVAGALLVAAGILATTVPWLRPLAPQAMLVHDPGLTLVLLGALGVAALPGVGVLAWLGQHSWAIYLGQLAAHNAAVFGLGLAGLYGGGVNLWLYTAYLLAGGLAFVAAGEGLGRLEAVLRARWSRAPARPHGARRYST